MGSPKTPRPPKVDIARDIGQYVSGFQAQLPTILASEAEFRPQFQQRNLADISAFLGGAGGQQGLFGLGALATEESQRQLQAARQAELTGMTQQAGLGRGLMEALSPEAAAQVRLSGDLTQQAIRAGEQFGIEGLAALGRYGPDISRASGTLGGISPTVGETVTLGVPGETISGYDPRVAETVSMANADAARAEQMAQEAFARRGQLSPEEQRAAQQQARQAAASRGQIGGRAGVAAEVLNREAAMAGRRAEAAQLGQQAFAQRLGTAQQRLASEQELFRQRASTAERDIAARQAMFQQRLGGAELGLGQQQALYGQREQDVARRMELGGMQFQQNLAAREAQRAAQAQGFGQFMNVSQQQQALREEAARRGLGAFELGQTFYTSPLLAMLGGAPTSYTAGQQQVGLGLGAIGAGTPQLYDIGTALNIGAAQRQNQVAAQAAGAQAKAGYMSGLFQGVGNILSDRRTKEDIKKVGKTDSGLPIYTFKYKGENTTQMGVMAQDVEKKKPKAVREIGGLKAVNYAMID